MSAIEHRHNHLKFVSKPPSWLSRMRPYHHLYSPRLISEKMYLNIELGGNLQRGAILEYRPIVQHRMQ